MLENKRIRNLFLHPTCEQTYTRILNFTLCTYYLVEREPRSPRNVVFSPQSTCRKD